MKKVFSLLLLLCGLLAGCGDNHDGPSLPQDSEATLFDKQAKPEVYISYTRNDSTIYLWDGTPVAYFAGEQAIYHFNGSFLGWYAGGILYDKQGYAVAARKGVVKGEIIMTDTYAEPVKGVKHILPVRHVRSLQTPLPLFKDKWNVTVTVPRFFLTEIPTEASSF